MDSSNNDKCHQIKSKRRDFLRYRKLVKQFENSSECQFCDPKYQITYQILQYQHVDEASQVNARAMITNPILRSIGMNYKEYLADSIANCQCAADHGLGCIVKDTNDKIVGVSTAYPLDVVVPVYNNVQRDNRKHEINILWDACVDMLITTPWHHYGDPNRMFYFEDVSVLQSASGRGIGYIAVEISMMLGKRKGYTHMISIAINDIILDDVYTRGSKIVRTIDISKIIHNGRQVFQGIIAEGTLITLIIHELNPSKL